MEYSYHYSYKPLSERKSEEELKDKNQLLEAVNKQLHQKLTETQVRSPPGFCHQPPLVMRVESQGMAPQVGAGWPYLGAWRQEVKAPGLHCRCPWRMGQVWSACMAPPQGELKDLTQKVELLEKFQDNCLAILESKGLNTGKCQHNNCLQRNPPRASSWVILDYMSRVWPGVSWPSQYRGCLAKP